MLLEYPSFLSKKTRHTVVIQEQYDPRTLYERLQEQRTMKEEKFLEESRLSNQIKRVDTEEAEYFRTLSDEKEKLEYERKVKEQLELEEYRQAVEARATPASQIAAIATAAVAVSAINTVKPKPNIKSNKLSKNSIKGALIVKKKKRDDDSEDESEAKEEKIEKPLDKKFKTSPTTKANKTAKDAGSLSLLSAAYGDISSTDSEED
jgi:hypothetical protein